MQTDLTWKHDLLLAQHSNV